MSESSSELSVRVHFGWAQASRPQQELTVSKSNPVSPIMFCIWWQLSDSFPQKQGTSTGPCFSVVLGYLVVSWAESMCSSPCWRFFLGSVPSGYLSQSLSHWRTDTEPGKCSSSSTQNYAGSKCCVPHVGWRWSSRGNIWWRWEGK